MSVDRYDVAIAVQVWQRMFVRASMGPHGVCMRTEVLADNRDVALEYLARGRMMQLLGWLLDGQMSALDQAAKVGLSIARDDVELLVDELDTHYAEFTAALQKRMETLREQGPEAIDRELARVPEMRGAHRKLLLPDLIELDV